LDAILTEQLYGERNNPFISSSSMKRELADGFKVYIFLPKSSDWLVQKVDVYAISMNNH
jgi:hypothetical protein